ncbi:hypothetical protein [Oxalicibacterium faecigallinarum]|uniref:Uncharacterized protein n=1 Tax=Oxalicibacterium faecigallinarum TaxID=573741 RepID=A0A8J3F1S4_9BURK|nr:hypothetical protein [Oxalicibacterium faecigallinarum]GGI19902.1 hypothetical protein GCM10008066_21350 [Oxalicibacterium faecigallinarum]
MANLEDEEFDSTTERPWIVLKTTYDVETWIDHQNRHLQRHAGKSKSERCGLSFHLALGGTIYLHTTQEGDVVLDVPEDAAWVAPAIAAATGGAMQQGQRWHLPADVLTQLVLGLSPLIAATDIVTDHDFQIRKF